MGIILKMIYSKAQILPPLFRNNYTQEAWEKDRETDNGGKDRQTDRKTDNGGKDRLTNGQIDQDMYAKIGRQIGRHTKNGEVDRLTRRFMYIVTGR
jgi:hypothetical protein